MAKSEQHSSRVSKAEPKPKQWPRAAIIATIVLLIGAVLVLKDAKSGSDAQMRNTNDASPTRAAMTIRQATTVPTSIASPVPTTAVAGELPETQLEQALAAGKPTLAFFHSNNCRACMTMMKVVDEVYPAFAASVVLIDVNVYDKQNTNLLQRTGVRGIPTQIFYDKTGQGQLVMGVMTPDALREQLTALAGTAGDCQNTSDAGVCAP